MFKKYLTIAFLSTFFSTSNIFASGGEEESDINKKQYTLSNDWSFEEKFKIGKKVSYTQNLCPLLTSLGWFKKKEECDSKFETGIGFFAFLNFSERKKTDSP